MFGLKPTQLVTEIQGARNKDRGDKTIIGIVLYLHIPPTQTNTENHPLYPIMGFVLTKCFTQENLGEEFTNINLIWCVIYCVQPHYGTVRTNTIKLHTKVLIQ